MMELVLDELRVLRWASALTIIVGGLVGITIGLLR